MSTFYALQNRDGVIKVYELAEPLTEARLAEAREQASDYNQEFVRVDVVKLDAPWHLQDQIAYANGDDLEDDDPYDDYDDEEEEELGV